MSSPPDTALITDSLITASTDIQAPPITGGSQSRTTIPLSTPLIPTSSSPPSQSQSPAAAISAPPPSIPIGAVVGASVGSAIFLFLVIAFILWHSRRSRIAYAKRVQRRTNKRSTWNRLGSLSERDRENHGMRAWKESNATPPDNERKSSSTSAAVPPRLSAFNFEQKDPFASSAPPRTTRLDAYESYSHPRQAPTPSVVQLLPTVPHLSPISTSYPPQSMTSHQVSDVDANADAESSFTPSHPYATQLESNPFEDPSPNANTNPFFTPHPSSHGHDVVEKWGSVGKERNVVSTPRPAGPSRHPSNKLQSTDGRMESLIAALDLESSHSSYSQPHASDRSLHGYLDRVDYGAEEDDEEGDEDPFSFDHQPSGTSASGSWNTTRTNAYPRPPP